jgi:hypothetical protein
LVVISIKNKHNFEPVEKILQEKMDELKGAEARYSKDFRFQSCHDFILVEYNCFFGLVGLSLQVTECLFNSFSFQFYFILQFLRMFATKSKKMMSDLNFNPIPSEIKYLIPGKETVNDIPNLFGSLQKMKIPQVQSEILVTWIPWVNKDDDTEKNGFISLDFVKSFTSELLCTERSMSLLEVNVMLLI